MPKMRTEVQHLEAQVQSGNKRFVRYAIAEMERLDLLTEKEA